ncbi:cupin domain-containing protein [Croceicoccus bisphenolivorans]|uniref:cupin domain-containing protein n=1 Tax=Croceicoccus bisphenolivorans TaxID=1783232 RepID=UPI0008303499|nr:cupin domain-containing protein [Croceicoccus bisphenolivorans]
MDTITDCPTFIDLAAIVAADPVAAGQDPFGADARILPVRAGPCEVFVTAVAAGDGSFVENGGDTWIFAVEGDLVLAHNGLQIALPQGTSAVIARGTVFTWQATDAVTVIGMRYTDAPEGAGGIVAIDNAATYAPSNPPADDVLLSEKPSCRSANQFASADDGRFKCGIWDSTPYTRLPILFRHTELMHLLEGEVSFTDAAGRSATFGKGDTFIIEQGARCSWDSRVDVAKIYATYKPAD